MVNKISSKKNSFMEKPFSIELVLILILILVFLASFVFAFFSNNLSLNGYYGSELYLSRYDKVVSSEDFCFTYNRVFYGFNDASDLVTIRVNDKVLFEEIMEQKINVCDSAKKDGCVNETKKEMCYSSSFLNYGENRVTITFDDSKVFFNIKKVETITDSYNLDFIDLNKNFVSFSINSDNFDFEPVEIFVNGELDHMAYPKNNGVFNEKINLSSGENKVVIKYRDLEINKTIFLQEEFKMNFIVGLLIFVFSFSVLLLFVFSKYQLLEKILLSFSTLFVLIILSVFVLNFINLLNVFSFLGLFLLLNIVLFLLFFKNYSITHISFLEIKENYSNGWILVGIFIALALVLPLIFGFLTLTPYSLWNTYYERQALTIVENNSLPLIDDLSFFGRPLGFSPGYFFLEAGLIWITGVSGVLIFSFILVLSNLFFALACLSFSKALSFSKIQSIILFFFVWAVSFIYSFLFLSPRHSIALGLFLVTLSLTISNKQKYLSALILAIVGLIQFPLFVAFPIVYLIVSKKIDFKNFLKMFFSSILFFVILFLPNLINFGMFTQAEKSNWGYLIVNNFDSFLIDFWFLLLFLIIIAIPHFFDSINNTGLNKNFFNSNYYKIKLLIFVLIGFCIQFFVTYRWNVFNTIILAVLLVEVIPKDFLKNKFTIRLIGLIFVIIILNGFIPLMSANLSMSNLISYNYLEKNTSSEDRIFNDPLFGHNISFFTKRKIMADLVVEYAPEEQLLDTFNFFEDKNYAKLNQYEADWVFNQPYVINRKSVGNGFLQTPLEFNKLDKVYDNGHFVIHYIPNEVDIR